MNLSFSEVICFIMFVYSHFYLKLFLFKYQGILIVNFQIKIYVKNDTSSLTYSWNTLIQTICISIAWCKTVVSPLLTHWRYHNLALATHQYLTCICELSNTRRNLSCVPVLNLFRNRGRLGPAVEWGVVSPIGDGALASSPNPLIGVKRPLRVLLGVTTSWPSRLPLLRDNRGCLGVIKGSLKVPVDLGVSGCLGMGVQGGGMESVEPRLAGVLWWGLGSDSEVPGAWEASSGLNWVAPGWARVVLR